MGPKKPRRSRKKGKGKPNAASPASHRSRSRSPAQSNASDKKSTTSSRTCRKLSDEEEITLLTWLKGTPCLWDQKSADFRRPQVKEAKWNAQAAVMGVPAEKLKAAFKNLRDWKNKMDKVSKAPGATPRIVTAREKLVVDRLQFLPTCTHKPAATASTSAADKREQVVVDHDEDDDDKQSSPETKKMRSAHTVALSGLKATVKTQEQALQSLSTDLKNLPSTPALASSDPDYARKSFTQWVMAETLSFSPEEFARFQSSFIGMREGFVEERMQNQLYLPPVPEYYPPVASSPAGFAPAPYRGIYQQQLWPPQAPTMQTQVPPPIAAASTDLSMLAPNADDFAGSSLLSYLNSSK